MGETLTFPDGDRPVPPMSLEEAVGIVVENSRHPENSLPSRTPNEAHITPPLSLEEAVQMIVDNTKGKK